MTLKEKIGQLIQISYAEQTLDETTNNQIANGMVGSFLNLYDVNMSNSVQKVAMEKSRLKIPLLIGKDIIHGSRTVFPIPLGQAATFNPDIVEEGARIAAI
jgi:beta-glucosidase